VTVTVSDCDCDCDCDRDCDCDCDCDYANCPGSKRVNLRPQYFDMGLDQVLEHVQHCAGFCKACATG